MEEDIGIVARFVRVIMGFLSIWSFWTILMYVVKVVLIENQTMGLAILVFVTNVWRTYYLREGLESLFSLIKQVLTGSSPT